jgi:hypothetical protein
METAQLSFRLPEVEKNRFVGIVKGAGLDVKEVLGDFVRSYQGPEKEAESESNGKRSAKAKK